MIGSDPYAWKKSKAILKGGKDAAPVDSGMSLQKVKDAVMYR